MPSSRTLAALVLAVGLTLTVSAQSGRAPATERTAQAPSQTSPPPAPAAAPAAPAEQPTFRTDINFVRVDAIVTDRKAAPVTDLKESDFEVTEDGKPQSIQQFRLIRIDGNPRPGEPPPREIRNRDDEELEAARDDVRVFVIFFDDYHTRLGTSLAVRQPLTQFVQNQLRPNDLVAIMYPLTPVGDVAFTRNQGSVLSAIENFQGRKYDYRPRNQFEEYYSQQPTEVVERIRNQVVMGALRGLSTRLGAIREGRKAVIFVSEGLTVMLPPQLRGANAEFSPVGAASGLSPLAGENDQREDTARVFAQSDLYLQMRDVFTEANRNNTAIYSLDPRGLAVNEFGIDQNVGPNQDRVSLQMTQDTLRSLSDETDGRAIVNRNDLARGLTQVVADSSAYYLLGYTSARGPADGKFHEIKVRVKRPGVTVRSRRGYWAPTAEDLSRARAPLPTGPPKPVEYALAAINATVQSSQYVRTWVGTERGEGGKTRVTLVWEPLSQAPGGGRRDSAGRIAVIAATGAGDLIYRGRTALPDSGAGPVPAVATAGGTVAPGPQKLVFDAPPGQAELRLSIEGTAGGVLDNDVRKLTIPDLTAPQAAMSTPRVFRARTARDFQAVARDAQAVPVPGREFSRTERLLIRFDVYGPGNEIPTATAVLMNRSGQKMADVPVSPAAAGGTHQIDLGLSSVAPGEYVVEITAKGTASEAKELIALRVVS